MKEDNEQLSFLDTSEAWRDEWQGMPEFEQPNQKPFRSLVVNFESEEDFKKFAKLTKQTINQETKSIWFPEKTFASVKDKRFYE